jgi:8-oxo-dGTP pyrophosphatase MutT (NUDIX family)
MSRRPKHRSTSTTTTDNSVRMTTITTRNYSRNSSASIPDSCFWTHDFQLAASMVIIQPSSGKVVLVNDTEFGTWFLPRGRKDIGETLEQCAVREAYEEVRFLRNYNVLFVQKGVACHARACRGERSRSRSTWRAGVIVRCYWIAHARTRAYMPPLTFLPLFLLPFPVRRKGEKNNEKSDLRFSLGGDTCSRDIGSNSCRCISPRALPHHRVGPMRGVSQ